MQMWAQQHPWMKHVWESLRDNISQACMYGSKMDKVDYNQSHRFFVWCHLQAVWWFTHAWFLFCQMDQNFQRQDNPNTRLSCKEMANCLAKLLVNKGTKFVDTNLSQQTTLAPRQVRIHGRKQLPPLLAEYWMVCDSVVAQQFPSYKQLKQLPPTCEKWGVIFVQQDEKFNHTCKSLEEQYSGCLGTAFAATCSSDLVQQWFGVLRKPDQTIKATLNVKRPMDLQIPLRDLLLQAVATVLTLGPGAVAERRAAHCSRILKRIKELETEEKTLHETLHPQVRSVLKGKRLLIWRELMLETGYPDLEIFDEVTEGIKLVGPAHESQAFPSGLTPAQQSVGQLCSQAVWRRKTSIGKCRSSGNALADTELWEQSWNEVEAGWFDGPFYADSEVSERVQSTDWICARRFPLQQPTKIRLVEDGLESGLNSAYSCYNKLTLMDMDAVVALANVVLQAFASRGVLTLLFLRVNVWRGRFMRVGAMTQRFWEERLIWPPPTNSLRWAHHKGLSESWWPMIPSGRNPLSLSSTPFHFRRRGQSIASIESLKACSVSWCFFFWGGRMGNAMLWRFPQHRASTSCW